MREKDDNELRPEFGPVSAPLPWRKATIIILLGIAAALIARKMANMRRRWPWESSPPQLTINLERGESYESWLARELETLRNSVRSGADSKESLARLSQAIRGYFSRRYVKPAEAWTTLEFQKHLISDERAREVSSWMVSWDGARFSATASLPNLLDQISNVEKLLVGRQEAA